jgi:hypothetical protein
LGQDKASRPKAVSAINTAKIIIPSKRRAVQRTRNLGWGLNLVNERT